jgi:acyl-coenzyme A synthetase/AMP-(fatty) acid ligase/aryl carrier-like protein
MIGGEAPVLHDITLWQQRSPEVRLINHYGPTEITVGCSTFEIVEDIARIRVLPIGRPIANTRLYILDGQMEPVPIGVAGELYIGGAGVARGYSNRADLTAERFVPDGFSGDGGRLYRTGDLCRYLADGNIEFLGRNDDQVKIRGYRIELGEIESRLSEHADVREAVVIAREDTPGEKRLVGYYTASAAVSAETLRAHLLQTLPEYMVPAAYVWLAELPLTPNGKLDRRALPAPDADAYASRGYEEPVGETERLLAEIWAELLQLDRVGRHDSFFELGGHSLLAVRLLERMRQAGFDTDVRTLFSTPTLASLAAAVVDMEIIL